MITSGVSPQVIRCVMSKSESRNRLIGIRMVVLGREQWEDNVFKYGRRVKGRMGNNKNGEY